MTDTNRPQQNKSDPLHDQDPLHSGIVHALPERILAKRAYLLGRLGREARRRFTQIISAWELNPSHYGVLLLLDEIGQASQQYLAQTLTIDRANMVSLLDLLEKRAFVERTTDPRDRRYHIVKLTKSGQAEIRQIRQAEEGLDEAFFRGLDKQEQAALHLLLVKLFKSLADA